MSKQQHITKKPKQTPAEIAIAHIQAKLDRDEAKRQSELREITANHIRETTGFYLDTTLPLHNKQFGNMPPYKFGRDTSPELLKKVLKR